MAYHYLQFEDVGTYCILRMNRPEKKNALNLEFRQEFMHALARIESRYRCVVLTGSKDSFSAGLDLSESLSNDAIKSMWELARAIYNHTSVFIAAVNGLARGGGLTLVNACDLALAGESASFGMPEITFGVYPLVAGPTTQLAIPRKAAAHMVLTGQPIDAHEARRFYVVNQVVPDDQLLAESKKLAAQISQLKAGSLAGAKRALNTLPVDGEKRDEGIEMALAINRDIDEMNKSGPGA